MATYRDDRDGRWRYRATVRMPDGRSVRISGTSSVHTKQAAQFAERAHIERTVNPPPPPPLEVPTFRDWFHGRYWDEWVIGRKNKPSYQDAKRSIYKHYLDAFFGDMKLDQIKVGEIARFRAELVRRGLTDKYINNILAVLSKPLHYAFDVELIPRAPKVGLFRIEQPEIVFWDFAEYARLLAAARALGPSELSAVVLAGEAGLRVGEVKALRWREDVDLIARTVTVNQQMRQGVVGTPKGRTRRTIPMTETLFAALKALRVVREGYVIRDLVGHAKHNENQIKILSYRVCRKAGLPERGWHTLRHTFGTHAAMLGVNPWRLMSWMGHKLINETHRYVHIAEAHYRDTPPVVLAAGEGEVNPDRRIIKQLGARIRVPECDDLDRSANRLPTEAQNDEGPGESRALSIV